MKKLVPLKLVGRHSEHSWLFLLLSGVERLCWMAGIVTMKLFLELPVNGTLERWKWRVPLFNGLKQNAREFHYFNVNLISCLLWLWYDQLCTCVIFRDVKFICNVFFYILFLKLGSQQPKHFLFTTLYSKFEQFLLIWFLIKWG